MKTTIIAFFTAAFLGLAAAASGRPFDAADIIAVAFTVGLVAWTFAQYSSTPRTLVKSSPIFLQIHASPLATNLRAERRAA